MALAKLPVVGVRTLNSRPELPVLGGEPVRERADATRNRAKILEAASELFAVRGAGNVSMEEIAAAASVGKGTLFRHYGDRAGLARAVLSERERPFQDAFISGPPPLGPGAPPADRLVAFGRGLIEVLAGHGDLLLVAEVGSPCARFRSPVYGAYRSHVTMLLRQGAPALDAHYLADVLLGALGAELFEHQHSERGMSLERIAAGYESLVRALVPGP